MERRTNADKRADVVALLNDAASAGKSDRWIAELCGVSNRFVGIVRDGMNVNGSQSPPRMPPPTAKPQATGHPPPPPRPAPGDAVRWTTKDGQQHRGRIFSVDDLGYCVLEAGALSRVFLPWSYDVEIER